jgi:hypothetical protein
MDGPGRGCVDTERLEGLAARSPPVALGAQPQHRAELVLVDGLARCDVDAQWPQGFGAAAPGLVGGEGPELMLEVSRSWMELNEDKPLVGRKQRKDKMRRLQGHGHGLAVQTSANETPRAVSSPRGLRAEPAASFQSRSPSSFDSDRNSCWT